MTPKAIEQASPDVREVIDRKLRADLDAAAEQHMPVMVVTTDYLRGVLDQIAQLQAELAEAREVPGRITEWLREQSDKQYDKGYDRKAEALSDAGDAIESRDWSKP